MPTLSLAETKSVGGHFSPHLPRLWLSVVRGGQGGAVCPWPAPSAWEGAQRYQGRVAGVRGWSFSLGPSVPGGRRLCLPGGPAQVAEGPGSVGEGPRESAGATEITAPVMGPLSRGSEHSSHPSFFSRRSPPQARSQAGPHAIPIAHQPPSLEPLSKQTPPQSSNIVRKDTCSGSHGATRFQFLPSL